MDRETGNDDADAGADYEPPTMEDLDAGDGPIVTAPGFSSP
jgi:hypothetical protein